MKTRTVLGWLFCVSFLADVRVASACQCIAMTDEQARGFFPVSFRGTARRIVPMDASTDAVVFGVEVRWNGVSATQNEVTVLTPHNELMCPVPRFVVGTRYEVFASLSEGRPHIGGCNPSHRTGAGVR